MITPEFHLQDDVRLLARHGDIPSGALGSIRGRFAHPTDPTYFVRFDAEDICVSEVRCDQLVLVGRRPTA